jgi:hypothetical protein
MPRRSAAAMSVAPIQLDPVPIPQVPDGLDEAEGRRWMSILCSKPPEWFDQGSLPLLTALVKHLSMLDKLSGLIDHHDGDLQDLNKLLLMRDRESRAAAMLSAKMRLTQSAQYEPERAKNIAMRGGRVPRPWEDPNSNPFMRNGRPRRQ